MTVRIRFARLGCKHRPFYRIVVADSKSQRDGKNLEILGYYDPLSGQDGQKRMSLKFERIKYWLSVGAQPSEPVERILLRSGLLAPPPLVASGGRKDGPGAKLTGAAEESGNSEDGISPEAVFSIGLQV